MYQSIKRNLGWFWDSFRATFLVLLAVASLVSCSIRVFAASSGVAPKGESLFAAIGEVPFASSQPDGEGVAPSGEGSAGDAGPGGTEPGGAENNPPSVEDAEEMDPLNSLEEEPLPGESSLEEELPPDDSGLNPGSEGEGPGGDTPPEGLPNEASGVDTMEENIRVIREYVEFAFLVLLPFSLAVLVIALIGWWTYCVFIRSAF